MQKFWKRAFFLLSTINGIVLLIILFLMLKPVSSSDFQEYKDPLNTEEFLQFDLILSSQEIESLFEKKMSSMNLPIKISVGEQFSITYPTEVFGKKVNMILSGNPKVREDGRVEILVQDIQVGQLPIPKEFALNLLQIVTQDNEIIQFDGEKNSLYVEFSSLDQDKGFLLKAKDFQPQEDKYTFSLEVNKNLILN